ncbi:MAG TPA: hypothetical protein VFW90_00155, partial [Candidatus Saccharimonadales bacterium]|nr:hypothetical protein [Candidatus Saccharimonadales bacterium]
GPLYVLGLMGATRRLDHYSASLGWQPLFIIAGLGAALLALGAVVQVLQLIVSIASREGHMDTTGDPWNGRTLEWSTASPPPEYNFARIPVITGRDAFWLAKHSTQHQQDKHPVYQAIRVPKNTSFGVLIGVFSFVIGFGAIWHIWWLSLLGLLASIVTVIIRASGEENERTISAKEIEATERLLSAKGQPA